MSVDIETPIVIERPRIEVAGYVADPVNSTSWYANIVSVTPKYSGAVTIGSQMEFVAQFLGRKLSYTYEVRKYVESELFVMSTSEGPFPMETTYRWEDGPSGGTRMWLRNRGTPSGFSSVAAPMMKAAMRRANKKDLARLKAILEGV